MNKKVKVYSAYQDKQLIAEVLEERKYTLKLKLEHGRIIIKKHKQIIKENV